MKTGYGMKLTVALIVTALAVTAFAAIGTDNSSAEGNVAEIPTAVSNLVYDGTEKTGVPEGAGYTITGNTAADAGLYKAKLTLKDGYVWSDNTTETKEITWNIGYKIVYITIKEAAVLLMSNDTSSATTLNNDEIDDIKQIINKKSNLIINDDYDNEIIKNNDKINYTIINDIDTVDSKITYNIKNINYNIINNDNIKYTIIKDTDSNYLIINNSNVIDKNNLTNRNVIVSVENSSYFASVDVNSIVYLAETPVKTCITTVDQLTAACHKVSFDKNNGNAEGTMNDITVMNKCTLPGCGFTVDNASFIGWSLTPDGDIIKTSEISITGDTTLYAVWGIDIPVAKTGLTYNCSEQTGVEEGEKYTLTGDIKATDAGDYTATATPKDGYVWSDGSEDAKEIPWSIAKGKIRLNITDSNSISYGKRLSDDLRVKFDDGNLTEFNGKFTVEYSAAGSGEYSTEEPKNAGEYYLKVTVTDPNIENPVLNYSFTISKIKLCDCDDGAFDIIPSGNITYDGNKHSVSIDISTERVYETITDLVTVSYSGNGSDYTDTEPVDVGTYSIKITAKSGSNYEEEKILENVLTIVPKTVTVSIGDVISAMNNDNIFADSSLNSNLNDANYRIVVKNTDYVITCGSSSNIILSNETTSIDNVDELVSRCSNISFNMNSKDAKGSMDDTIALNGYDLPECGFTSPEGMHFAGWSLTADGKAIATESIPVTEKNVTLYAIWEATEGTISSESTSYRFAADNITTGSIEVILKEGESEYRLTFAKGENVGGKTVSVTLNSEKTAENVTAYNIETDGISDFNVKLPCKKGFDTVTVLCDGLSEGVSNVSYNSDEGYVTFTSNHNSLFTVTVSDAPASDSEIVNYCLIAAIAVLIFSVVYFAVIKKM